MMNEASRPALSPEVVVRGLYAALQAEEPTQLGRWVSDDVVVEIPGNSPNAGRYEGIAAFRALVSGARERSGGSLRFALHDLAVGRDNVVAVATYTAERPGRPPLRNDLCHLLRVEHGQVVYSRLFTGDQYAVDAFWQD